MIKFFRNIRQKLIIDNKTAFTSATFSKYLLYAIGEVVLIVIGILIALSLNNKNQNKKLLIQEVKILHEINSELIGALVDLNNDLEAHSRNLRSTEIIYNSILHKKNYDDSLKEHLLFIIDYETFTAKQSAFESLQSIVREIIY